MSYSRVPAPPPFRVLQEVAGGLDAAVTGVLDERYANPTDQPDLLNMLIGADDGSWSRKRVRDEALTFMLAGHETTANALSWFWYLMALHPQHRERMLDEVDSVLAGRRVTADDLSQLPWTTACVMESQRYYSAVPLIPRTALADDVLGRHRIRKGTSVLIPVHAIHHDERYWDDPDAFDPQRFMPGAARPVRSTYLPFGGGRRVCIGQSFALMEMVAIAATLSQRYVFDLEPGHPVVLAQSLTLRPKHGLRTVVRRRCPALTAASPGTGSVASAADPCPVHVDPTNGGRS
ncbi:cytochrome P450 [Nocardioides marmoraquaticus]